MTKKILAVFLAAVMLLSFAACSGNKGNGKITATLDAIYEDGGMKEYYLNNEDSFIKAAQSELSMDENSANAFLTDSDNWQVYSLDVQVLNKKNKAYTFVGFEVSGDMAEGFYFSNSSINAELSIPYCEEAETYSATIIVDSQKVSVEQMYTVVAGLEISLLCYPTPKDDDKVISEEDYEKIVVENNITAPEADGSQAADEIAAKRTSLEDGSAFLEIFRKNDVAFSNEAKLYGMDSETAAKALAKDGGWECYILYLDVENKTDEDLTVYTINTANNGKNGMWINSVSQYGEFSMEPGASSEMPITVLLDKSQLGGMTAEKALEAMEITLTYSKGTLIDAEGNESVAIRKTAEVE